MKKYLLILFAILVCAGCGKKQSLKVEDPAVRESMRTRDENCPIDSLFTRKGVRTSFDVFSHVKPKVFINDFKAAQDSTVTKPLARMKGAYATVEKEHAGDYNPGLTIYSIVIIIVFVALMLFKIIRAIFKND